VVVIAPQDSGLRVFVEVNEVGLDGGEPLDSVEGEDASLNGVRYLLDAETLISPNPELEVASPLPVYGYLRPS